MGGAGDFGNFQYDSFAGENLRQGGYRADSFFSGAGTLRGFLRGREGEIPTTARGGFAENMIVRNPPHRGTFFSSNGKDFISFGEKVMGGMKTWVIGMALCALTWAGNAFTGEEEGS